MTEIKKAVPANSSTRVFGTASKENRERMRLDVYVRRGFASLPVEVRRDGLRRRAFYSLMDATFL